MYKIGDKVKTKYSTHEGEIISKFNIHFVVEFTNAYGEKYTSNHIESDLISLTAFIKCECGAAYTSFADCHASYCPKYSGS
jgi:hypothetical protein